MSPQEMKSMGKRLQLFRVSKGLTQEQFAEMLGITWKFLGMIERGERSMSINTLMSLHQNCHCDINYILSGDYAGTENPYSNIMHSLNPKQIANIDELICVGLKMIEDK